MSASTDNRRTQWQLQRQKIQQRVEQIQGRERRETDNAHEWENASTHDDMLAVDTRELRQVDAALQRIERGTYGICDVCDEPIAEKRMEALPYATRCIKCADSIHKRTFYKPNNPSRIFLSAFSPTL